MRGDSRMRLVLGTAQFGLEYGIANQTGQVAFDEVGNILAAARSLGIDTLDTAVAYGDAESVLGKADVSDWQVISKLPALPDNVENVSDWVKAQIDGSLARLGVDHLYAVLLHRPGQLFEAHGKSLLQALQSLKAQGIARKIGVSIYAPAELERLFGEVNFDLVQAPFNILDRRLVETGWARRLKAMNVEVHARSVFLQGLLLMTAQQRPAKFARWQNVWAEWCRWLQENELTPLQACMRYVLLVPEVDRIVVGVDSVRQLREIHDAAGKTLPNLPSWPQTVDENLINPSNWNTL